jgi:hypothetical protein
MYLYNTGPFVYSITFIFKWYKYDLVSLILELHTKDVLRIKWKVYSRFQKYNNLRALLRNLCNLQKDFVERLRL